MLTPPSEPTTATCRVLRLPACLLALLGCAVLQVCQAALPDPDSHAEPQAVYAEMKVLNTHR